MTAPSENNNYTYRNQVNAAIGQLRLALETNDMGGSVCVYSMARCRTRAMRSGSSPSSTRTARDGPHENRNRAPGLPWG